MSGPGPKRTRLSRVKGWRMPGDARRVSRPSRWGNPFKVDGVVLEPGFASPCAVPLRSGLPGGMVLGEAYPGLDGVRHVTRRVRDREDAVALFRAYVTFFDDIWRPEDIRASLRGLDLACWCPLDQPCHADVLLEIANGRTQ